MEVLIALSIVTLCIIPLVSQPLRIIKRELAKLELMEKERLADRSFSEVKEMFLKGEILWEMVPDLYQTTGPFFLSNAKIDFLEHKEKSIRRKFTLYGKGRKPGANGEEYRQIYVKIFFDADEHFYEFRLPLRKLPLEK